MGTVVVVVVRRRRLQTQHGTVLLRSAVVGNHSYIVCARVIFYGQFTVVREISIERERKESVEG